MKGPYGRPCAGNTDCTGVVKNKRPSNAAADMKWRFILTWILHSLTTDDDDGRTTDDDDGRTTDDDDDDDDDDGRTTV